MKRWCADTGDQAAQGSDFWEKGEEREVSPEAASAYIRESFRATARGQHCSSQTRYAGSRRICEQLSGGKFANLEEWANFRSHGLSEVPEES